MKLYMKQKVFSLRDKFWIKDESEKDKYYVEGQISFGKKLHIYDDQKREIALIQEKLAALFGKYEVSVGGTLVATVKGKPSLLKTKLNIEELGWLVEGTMTAHEFGVFDREGRELARVSKAWVSWGDSYEIDIADEKDEVLILAVVLAVDILISRK